MKIRILQLGKFHPIKGGVEKVMMAFMLGLSSRGVQCDMLCAADDDDIGETVLNSHSKLFKTKTIQKRSATMLSPDMITKLRELCHSYDIIHVHHPDPMAALALFLSGYKGKVVLHWHSDILKQRVLLQMYKPLQNWLVKRADLILGTTPIYVRESPYLSKVQSKIDFLPIGVRERVPEEEIVGIIRNQYPGKKIVYSMGRLVEYKGYEYLIDAAKQLSDEYVVLIGGIGPLKEKLQKQIRMAGLESKVHILGFIHKEVEAAYYAACDVFCLSSTLRTEAYAIVQVEAMSVGRPIVATKIPGSGVSWVNQDGVSGINVEPKNSLELARAIERICSDSDLYRRLSAGAKERYRKLFTREAMIDGLMKHYGELLS